MDEGWLVMTRHMPLQLEQFRAATEGKHVPIGAMLKKPFPTAKLMYIDHRDRWIYAYWIDGCLTSSGDDVGTPDRD